MNIKTVSLDVWVQLIGMMGLLGGLVFVGMEMQQSQRIALAGQQQERAADERQNYRSFLEAGYDLDYIARAEGDALEDMSQEDLIARRAFNQIYWYTAENDFIQYQNDLMSDEMFEAKKRNLEYLLSQCDLRDIFEFRRTFFSEEFLELVSTIEDPCI
jgi:hypothetical protein|tara:strand:- start:1797 stop:2270 length:474 start_codon:yes stop_codon:yes gene_type:complete